MTVANENNNRKNYLTNESHTHSATGERKKTYRF